MTKRRTITKQQAFDRAAARIWRQGGPSFSPASGMCQYRGPNGRRCAVGEFLPNRSYRRELEGKGACTLARDGLVPEISDDAHCDFYTELQDCHDDCAPVRPRSFFRHYERSMRGLARHHGLSAAILDRLKTEAARKPAPAREADRG